MNNIKKFLAMSLAELLVATVIFSILILVVFKIYLIIKNKTLQLREQITLLYNQNVADYFIRSHVSNAGYKGINNSSFIPGYSSIYTADGKNVIPQAAIAVCKNNIINCKEFVTNKVLAKIKQQAIKPNTDILLIYDIPQQITTLIKDMPELFSPLLIAWRKDQVWESGNMAIISDLDCYQRFIISDHYNTQIFHDLPYNNSNKFIKKFNQGAQIILVKHVAFYIAKSMRANYKKYSLYLDDLTLTAGNRAVAIIDDVYDFKVQVLSTDQVPVTTITSKPAVGWVNHKYLLITLVFKGATTISKLVTGMVIRNNIDGT